MTLTEERTPSSQQNRLEQTENTEMLVVSLKQILKKKRFSHRQKNKNKWSNKSPNHNSNFFCKAVKKKTKKNPNGLQTFSLSGFNNFFFDTIEKQEQQLWIVSHQWASHRRRDVNVDTAVEGNKVQYTDRKKGLLQVQHLSVCLPRHNR